MLLYYEEGNPAACVAPDVFVVQGVAKGERRTYKLWEEGTCRHVLPETKRELVSQDELSAPARGNANMIGVTASRRCIRTATGAARIASGASVPQHSRLASA